MRLFVVLVIRDPHEPSTSLELNILVFRFRVRAQNSIVGGIERCDTDAGCYCLAKGEMELLLLANRPPRSAGFWAVCTGPVGGVPHIIQDAGG